MRKLSTLSRLSTLSMLPTLSLSRVSSAAAASMGSCGGSGALILGVDRSFFGRDEKVPAACSLAWSLDEHPGVLKVKLSKTVSQLRCLVRLRTCDTLELPCLYHSRDHVVPPSLFTTLLLAAGRERDVLSQGARCALSRMPVRPELRPSARLST